jgi:hypothetical protein
MSRMSKRRKPEIMVDLPSATYAHREPLESTLRDEKLGDHVWLRWHNGRLGRRMLAHVLRGLSDELLDDDKWRDD